MVRGLVPSMTDMDAEIHIHSDEQVRYKGCAILSSRTDVRAIAILGMEALGQLPGTLSLGLSSHFDVIEGCVPT